MKSTNSSSLQSLTLLHKSLLTGQVVFVTIALFLSQNQSINTALKNYDRQMQAAAVLVAVTCFFIGLNRIKSTMRRFKASSSTPQQKIAAYRTASIIQWALLEAAALFSIICFVLTGNYAFLALSGTLILFFGMAGPSKVKMMLLLGLTDEEAAT